MTRKFNSCECGGTTQRQWLFLGLSVKSFNASINNLNDGGSVSVQLKEDPEPVCQDGLPKLKLNSSLQTVDHTGPDPGWFGDDYDLLGRPVLFKHGDFEFAGIIHNISRSDSATSIADYRVEIVSPYFLLEKVNLICGEYKGYVDSVPNLLNIYGLYENNECSTFGYSSNFGNGMPWNKIAHGIEILSGVINNAGSILLGKYLQSNRIKYVVGLNIGCGLIPETDTGYILDIKEVPSAPSSFLIEGNNVNLLEAISTVVDAAGFEYYIELIPVTYSGVIYKIIKIRTIDRTGPVSYGSLDTFISNYNPECGVINKEIGLELRDATASNFVTGPPKQQMYYVWGKGGSLTNSNESYYNYATKTTELINTNTIDYSESAISPFWGLDVYQNCIFTAKKSWNYGCFSSAVYTYNAGVWTLTVGCPPGCDSKPPAPDSADLYIDGGGFYYLATYEWDTPGNDWILKTPCPVGSSSFPPKYPNPVPADGTEEYQECYLDGQTTNKSCFKAGMYMPTEDGISFFYANSSILNNTLDVLSVGNSILVSEFELIAAMQGVDHWRSFITVAKTATYDIIEASDELKANIQQGPNPNIFALYINVASSTAKAFLKPFHSMNLRKVGDIGLSDSLDSDEAKLFNFIVDLANTYYGKKFMIRVPYLCAKVDPDTLQVSYNREIVEGGWPEEDNFEFFNLLGIPVNSNYMQFFKNEDGSIGAYVRFDNAVELDSEELTQSDYGYLRQEDGVLWVKCSVDKDFVFGDFANRTDPRIVITLPGRLYYRALDQYYDPNNGSLIFLHWPTWATKAGTFANVLNKTHRFADSSLRPNIDYYPTFFAQPDAVTVPLQNKDETYGPWLQLSGTSGITDHISDPDLVPWNFGGLSGMNTAGQAIALFGVTDMYKSEKGSIRVPGNPVSRLGEEILSFDGTGYIVNQRDASTRVGNVLVSSSFTGVTYLFTNLVILNSWTGSLGPIITGLNISVGPDGISTTYSFDLYSKGYKRFAKYNIDRNKESSINRQKILSDLRRKKFG